MHKIRLCRFNLGSFLQLVSVLLTCANALPSFPSSPYTATVSELTPVGTTLLNITAVPGTPGNTLTYSIFNNPPIIEIDTVTGSVILVGPLDYEQETMYQFNVQAHEGSDVAMKQVTVSVLNENDNPLTCNRTLIIHTVAEGPTQDSSSVPLSCLDRDEPMPGSISYQIESTNNTSLFSIDSTGTIHITSSLDYEQETQHEVMVNVTSGGDGGAAATTPDSTLLVTVLIIVESVNEFSPTFDSDETLTLSLSEDTAVGSTVGAVNASDADRGCDGELTFSIISEKFAIESLTGQLVLIETLDYEREGFHELTVIVSDHPRDESQRRSTTATVDITVENVNEYPPQFSQAVYSVSVLETEGLGNELIMLMCTDGDSDSTLSYSITSDNNTNHFIIDPFSGTVALASEIEFDPMLPSPLSLTVQCIDSGSPSRSVEALLLTTVVGINRNIPPSLNTTEYVVEVNENTPPGTVMVDTLSSDVTDSNRGLAGPLQFTLVHGATCSQDTFQIDSVSGTLYTVGHLDHETLAEHHCTVSVANTGSTTTAEFDVKVSVTNTNDEVPLCLPSLYTLTLPEDSVVGSHVLTLSCTDADGDGLQYSIEGSSTVFKLTQNATQTSTLSLVAPLDSDVLSTHNIRINVSDGHHSTQLMVFVYVEPSNEHVPVFNQSVYDCSVSETASIGSVFCAVMAEDSDAGADGTTTYSITSGNEQNTFAINSSTGGLVLAGFIDYELVQGYLIVVQATDNGKSPLSTSVQVRITVIDDNDNAPIISPLITSTVAENLTAGSTVTMLDCSDIDSGPNGEVTMAIESQLNAEGISSSVFTIYSLTNELIASTDIDYESSVVYTVTLTCRDNGSVPLASSSMIVISVSPVNEFAPVISQANYSLTIPENSTVGTIILKVIATDSDRGLDGHILFSIEPEESGRDFLQISETSGDITTQQLLNCDWGQEHVFTVTATDEGTPALGSQSRLLVTLSNCRLGELIPGEVVYLANVTENSPADTEVTVVACDYNRTLWQGSGAVEYAITSPTTSPFQVDPLSGQISLTAPPDYEQSASHMLQISCSDPSDSQSRVSFSVYIAILPLNEHPPQFTLSAYTAEVGEDALPGTSVLRVEAADDDAGRDGSLVYSIVESEHPFVVDSKTGEIYTGDFLDRETKSMHTFHVVVADQEAQGDSVRSSMTEITVDIVDSNDNPPRCDRVVYHVTLSPLSDTGHRVVEPVCTDADSGLNSELTYSLHVDSFTSLEMFTLDEETGVLSLAHQFTATSSPVVHEMVITVEDGGTPPLSVAALVLVELERGSLVGTDEMQEGGESPVEAEGTKNAINFTLMDMSLELWSAGGMESFQSAMAHSVTSYCALMPEACSLLSGCAQFYKKKRSTEDSEYFIAVFSEGDVVLVPQSVQQYTSSDGRTHLNITFYVTLPEGTQKADYRTTDYVVPGVTLSLMLRDEGSVIESRVRDSVSPSLTLRVEGGGGDSLCWVWAVVVFLVIVGSCALVAVTIPVGVKKWKSATKRGAVFPIKMTTGEQTVSLPSPSGDIRGGKKCSSIKKGGCISLSELAGSQLQKSSLQETSEECFDDISTIDLADAESNKTSLQGQPRSRDSPAMPSSSVSGNSLVTNSKPQCSSSNSQDSLGDYKQNFPFEPPRGTLDMFHGAHMNDRRGFRTKINTVFS